MAKTCEREREEGWGMGAEREDAGECVCKAHIPLIDNVLLVCVISSLYSS